MRYNIDANSILQQCNIISTLPTTTTTCIFNRKQINSVGKSSVINSLKRARVCNVGSTPGQTKHAQEIHLDRLIRLIDSPGIVFSAAASSASSTVLRNIVKVELLTDPVAPVQAIIDRCKREQLMHVYAIPYFDTCEMFLVLVARKKGRIGRVR